MALECPKCRHPIDPADLNIQADIAKCGSCGVVFRPSAALAGPGAGPTVEAEAPPEPPPVDRLPEKSRIRVVEHGGTFAVRFPPAGFAMLFGILWPLFGHTEVRIEGRDCLYRASLFGVGRTRRASRDETALRWIEEGFMPPSLGRWRSASQGRWLGFSDTCLFLTLGTWETPFGATVSRREQEYVYHALKRALQQR